MAGTETYVINQYLDNGINWGQCGGENAQAGVAGSGISKRPPSSGTPQIVDIELGRNVGGPGKYVYCVTQGKTEPTSKSFTVIFITGPSR